MRYPSQVGCSTASKPGEKAVLSALARTLTCVDTTLHDPLVGQLLDGRYRVDARIAVGGMATVYRAVDTRLDRVLALKVMHPTLAADGHFVDRFIREAKSVARLAHPNVVQVFDQGADRTYVYLAMEYVAAAAPCGTCCASAGRSSRGPPWTSWSRCSPRWAPRTGPGSCTGT